MTQILPGETRDFEQLKAHYAIERELALRLRSASRNERRGLYSALYDELFRRVPLHPQLTSRATPATTALAVSRELRFLRPLLHDASRFLELGPGDCALSAAVAQRVRRVYAVDVSLATSSHLALPGNLEVIISDGTSVPVARASIDVAYSNQLMEHLHPDDAYEQLENVYAALVPGGVYVCSTPNRLSGPHDISVYFDAVATGFHLREYTIRELRALFGKAGFSRIQTYVGARGRYVRVAAALLVCCEDLLLKLPPGLRQRLARKRPLRLLLGIRIIGFK